MKFFSKYFYLLLLPLLVVACAKIDVFERTVAIPQHQWQRTYIPTFDFNITDTTTSYQLYLIVRHDNRYSYNNLWINLHRKGPDSTETRVRYEIPLATSDRGWLGTGMGDVYEHRIVLPPPSNDSFYFRSGIHTFGVEHIMRENPLHHVLNVGIRLEKKVR